MLKLHIFEYTKKRPTQAPWGGAWHRSNKKSPLAGACGFNFL